MRKRQKIILILYMYMIVFLGFLYVPYVQYLQGGVKTFVGHHFRIGLFDAIPWEKQVWGHVTIDANLIIAEIIALTAIATVVFLLFKKD